MHIILFPEECKQNDAKEEILKMFRLFANQIVS